MKEIMDKLSAPLMKDDVEVRVAMSSQKGFSLLLYKTARVDVKRLNESGAIWRNEHNYDAMGLLTCKISLYDTEHGIWIDRCDVGTESKTEKEKGLYSDSFKRCGFRWGIGLELYNAPFIWVNWEMYQQGNSWRPKNMFAGNLKIDEYETKDGHFTALTISYNSRQVYSMRKEKPSPVSHDKVLEIESLISKTNTDRAKFLQYFHVQNVEQLDITGAAKAMAMLERKMEEMK